MRRLIPIIVVAALACQPDDSPPGDAGAQARDSAGIRIIENAPPPDDSRLPWRSGRRPLHRQRGNGPRHDVSRTLRRLPLSRKHGAICSC